MDPARVADRSAIGWRLLGYSLLTVVAFRVLFGSSRLPSDPLALLMEVLFTSVCLLSMASVMAFVLALLPALVFTRFGATTIHRNGLPASDHLLHRGAMIWLALFFAVYTLLLVSLPGLFEGLSRPELQELLAAMLIRSVWGVAAITAPVAMLVTLAQRQRHQRLMASTTP